MTVGQVWFRGARILIAMATTLFPGCFYALFLTGALSYILPYSQIELGNRGATFLWAAISLALAPFFVAAHANLITNAINNSN